MNSQFSPLFESYILNNGVEIKNRLVVAPMTHFGSNTDGTLGAAEREFISNRASNMGMFILAETLVQDGGKAFHSQPEAIYFPFAHISRLKTNGRRLIWAAAPPPY